MRKAFLLLIVVAGCYNPSLQSPGFFCHASDNPPCPDGQQCMNGRCVSKNGRPMGSVDMSMDTGQDSGIHFLGDMAMMNMSHDFAMMTGGKTGCNGLITCINNCPTTDMNCPTVCQGNTTTNGNSLFNSLLNCLLAACPNTFSTDVCYNQNSTACMQCFSNAQAAGGACYNQLVTCHNDLP